jgi:hypothetical protein
MVPVALPLVDVAFVESNGGVPIVLATPGVAIVPNAGEVDGVIELLLTDIAVDAVGEVDAVACPDDGEQLTLVPGVVGSSASGTGARVVFGVPGSVTAEKGLGPVRGDATIAPGVDGIPIAVVPMVETCARQVLPPSSNAITTVETNGRIAAGSCSRASLSAGSAAFAARPCCLRLD